MTRGLIHLLACPTCRSELMLSIETERDGHVETGTLTCRACSRRWPIAHGVPRFVESDGYVQSFSYEWNRWNDIQLDSLNGSTESEATFGEKTGLTPEDLRGKVVLDVGCGAGRFLDVVNRWGARVVGVDYSYAVDAAQRTLGHRRHTDVVQADVFSLPFKNGVFDIVFSIGVLHHARDTRGAFLCLPRHLKNGGRIAVWLYHYTDPLYKRASDAWRAIFSRAPARVAYAWSWLLVVLFSRLYMSAVVQHGPLRHLPRVLPANTHPNFRWRVLDTFDWYTPRFQDKDCSPTRVVRWFSEAGLRDLKVLDFRTSVCGRRDDEHALPVFHSAFPSVHGARFVVFGAGAAGATAMQRLRSFGLDDRVVAVCDNSPTKIGTILAGHVVRRFDELSRDSYDFVLVASLPGRQEISKQLVEAGLVANREFGTVDFVIDTVLPLARAVAA